MILDSGICTIFREMDGSTTPGSMPVKTYTRIFQSWYGELNFETSPVWQTEGRKEQRIDKRIRVMQNREIRQNDVVVLENISAYSQKSTGADTFRITRAYHGQANNSPDLISDLTLEVIEP